jgi:hypothetical protein
MLAFGTAFYPYTVQTTPWRDQFDVVRPLFSKCEGAGRWIIRSTGGHIIYPSHFDITETGEGKRQ